jgi:hypothetical protein
LRCSGLSGLSAPLDELAHIALPVVA